MKKKWPIICPKGSRVIITQGFKPLNNPTHNAVDFVINNFTFKRQQNLQLSYGSQLVCPVKEAKCVLLNDFGPMNALGNGVDIEWLENGYYWRLHFWHTVYNELVLGQIVKEGQIVGLMGNTGDCRPIPTIRSPYEGTHCHCRFSRYKKNQWGGNIEIVSLDMKDYFDINNPYTGVDSPVMVDMEPLKWSWTKLGISKDNFKNLIDIFTNLFTKKKI